MSVNKWVCLRIVFVKDLLKSDKLSTTYQKTLQPLFIELFKVKRDLSNNIMCDIFSTRKISGNLRSEIDLVRNCINTYINYLIYLNIPRYT